MSGKTTKVDYDGKIAGLYDLECTIGRGHFAVVKLARHVFTGEKVAVKVIDKTKLDEVSKSHLFQEVRCMKLVQHPNVVRLYEVIDTQTKLYLILELGDGGDMYDYIMKQKGLKEEIARNYFKQIVEAIAYCHRLHVVHRDLKPENVVFFEKQGLVKLTDFGFSNMFKPGKKLDTSCGSLAYSAPEILLGDAYDAPAVDIWSLGVILYMLVCGEPPFQEANDSETLTMIMDCKYHLPSHISADCKNLISRMLKRNPSERLTLDEIIADPWLHMADSPSTMITPLISREHLSEEDHNHVIQRMVDGNIASREDIMNSLAKDSYDHITSTYYLLAERRLKKHHLHQKRGSIKKGHGDIPIGGIPPHPNNSKMNLEPLALSPRKLKELKKARTAPVQSMRPMWPRYPGTPSAPLPIEDISPDFVKSLNLSRTLDRHKNLTKIENTGLDSKHPPETQKKSKISALKSFFEQKAASLSLKASARSKSSASSKKSKNADDSRTRSSTESPQDTRRSVALKRVCGPPKKQHNVQPKQSREDPSQTYISSLLSPQSSHPPPITESGDCSPNDKKSFLRKCSLIHEESIDEEEDEFDMDITDLQPPKFIRTVDDGLYQPACSESGDPPPKRTLTAVASSPLLLKQINEEGESDDEEDDLVPAKINSQVMIARQHTSPDMTKKYDRRRRRGTGQRGTSCSSSDASDTDDTESRSRKEKLKHKIVHRRDSGDHSSDTDTGPGGPGPGGGSVGGARFGSSSSGVKTNGSTRSRSGQKENKSGDNNNNNNGGRKQNDSGSLLSSSEISTTKRLAEFLTSSTFRTNNKKSSDISVTSTLSSLSLASMSSKNSWKYMMDEDYKENEKNFKLSHVAEVLSREFSDLSDHIVAKDDRHSVCSFDCKLNQLSKRRSSDKIKTDINSNGLPPGLYAKNSSNQLAPIKYETKCCSIV